MVSLLAFSPTIAIRKTNTSKYLPPFHSKKQVSVFLKKTINTEISKIPAQVPPFGSFLNLGVPLNHRNGIFRYKPSRNWQNPPWKPPFHPPKISIVFRRNAPPQHLQSPAPQGHATQDAHASGAHDDGRHEVACLEWMSSRGTIPKMAGWCLETWKSEWMMIRGRSTPYFEMCFQFFSRSWNVVWLLSMMMTMMMWAKRCHKPSSRHHHR